MHGIGRRFRQTANCPTGSPTGKIKTCCPKDTDRWYRTYWPIRRCLPTPQRKGLTYMNASPDLSPPPIPVRLPLHPQPSRSVGSGRHTPRLARMPIDVQHAEFVDNLVPLEHF